MSRLYWKVKEVIALSATPPSIIYPFPILAMLAFSLSETLNIASLLKAIVLSSVFQAGINLWNHLNDVETDIIAGKRNILTDDKEIRKSVLIISPMLYLISLIMAIFWTVDKSGIYAFVAVALVTWIYSDKMFFGKIFRRWKDQYITEVLTYIIAIPAFTTLLWTLFTNLSIKSVAFSTIMMFYMLSGTFLKDIKDITGDKLAGLRTLGVVFSPESLLKSSILLLVLYYISISIFSFLGILSHKSIVSIAPSVGLIYTIYHFTSTEWNITLRSLGPVKIMIYSTLASLIILTVAELI